MPQMGYDMQEGTIVSWKKKEGDSIERGEVLVEIETEKAVVEMDVPTAGVVGKLVVEEGATVPVGQPIAIITQPGEPVPEVAAPEAEEAAAPAAETPPPAGKTPPAATSEAPAAGRVRASPIARRLAKEKGIDLSLVRGTGPGGRVAEADVRAFEEAPAPAGKPQRVQLSRMRLAIGRRTADSKRQAPHFYVSVSVEMDRALEMRQELNESPGEEEHITVNDLIIKAATQALTRFPNLNSTFEDDHLLVYPDINIGIVLAVGQGLIVPAIPQAQEKSLAQISRLAKDLLGRAREGTLKPEEYGGATFAVSNLGMFDVDEFIAVIMPPNSAMLGIGSIRPQPVVRDGQVVVRQMMKATLSVDHRVTDGVEAAKYLAEFRRLLEQPVNLLPQ
jgi:pyruvate dehydrogenase E2 component (dihydrolipoamide acetyltransferase)